MKTLVICNHKGGTGKTTTAYHLTRHMAAMGKRPLAIDLDPQGSLTRAFRGMVGHNNGIADVLMDRATLNGAAQPIMESDHIKLVGTDIKLSETAAKLQAKSPNHMFLRRALAKNGHFFTGPIIIDCAPAADILIINALVAADYLILPVDPCKEAIAGAQRMMSMAAEISDLLGQGPQVLGTIVTRFDGRTVGHRECGQTIAMPGMPPVLGVIPLRLGVDAREQIGEAYRPIAEKIMEEIDD